MAMSENVNIAWQMFKNLGYSDVATSALLGNAMTESYPDLRPTAVNEDDADSQGSSAFGIFQWRDSKKEGAGGWDSPRIQWLKTYAREKNLDPNDIRTQVLFTDWELRNKFRSTYDKLRTSNNLNDATLLVDSDYLFSRKTSKNTESRLNNANQVLLNFKGITGNMDIRNEDEKFNEKKIKEYENFIDKNQIYKNMSNSGDDMENKDNSTFIGKFKNYVSNPDNFGDMMGRLGTLANRLTLDPDPQYASRMNEGRLLQQQMEKNNRTADILAGMGQTELAEMMRMGQIDGGEALRYIQSKEKLPSDLKIFRLLKESGEIDPNTEYTDWKAKTLGVTSNFQEEKLFEMFYDEYKEYSVKLRNVAEQKTQIDLLKSLAENGIFSGALANSQLFANQLAQKFGLTSEYTDKLISNTEAFKAFSNRMVLDIMGGSLGVGFSDGDRIFAEGQAPNLSQTKEGIIQLADYMEAVLKRKMMVADEMQKYLTGAKEGGLNAFRKWAFKFGEDNPIFPPVDTL